MSSHLDNIEVIGTTHATSLSTRDKRWNRYYHGIYESVVTNLLRDVTQRETLLDVGTSHGHWYPFFKRAGFGQIVGIELDEQRAALAKRAGYDKVMVGDASNAIPYPSDSFDLAISNDVFVHILQMKDKRAAIAEIQRVLKPGATLILNHTISSAFGYEGYTVDGYCSYLSVAEFKALIAEAGLQIEEIRPTYFNFRQKRSLFVKILRASLTLPVPMGIALNRFFNSVHAGRLPLDASDVVYIKARKTG